MAPSACRTTAQRTVFYGFVFTSRQLSYCHTPEKHLPTGGSLWLQNYSIIESWRPKKPKCVMTKIAGLSFINHSGVECILLSSVANIRAILYDSSWWFLIFGTVLCNHKRCHVSNRSPLSLVLCAD